MIRFNQPGIPQCSCHRGWSCVPQSSSFQWAKRKVNRFWQASGFRSGNVGFEKEVVWLQFENLMWKLQPEILDTQPVILVKGVILGNTFCITDCVLGVWIVHPVRINSSALHRSLRGLQSCVLDTRHLSAKLQIQVSPLVMKYILTTCVQCMFNTTLQCRMFNSCV